MYTAGAIPSSARPKAGQPIDGPLRLASGRSVREIFGGVEEPQLRLLAFLVDLLLGSACGITCVSGLLEIQRIARPDELAGLSGVVYAFAHVGFLMPAIMAQVARWFSYPEMLTALALLAIGSTAVVGTAWARYLPTAQTPAAVNS